MYPSMHQSRDPTTWSAWGVCGDKDRACWRLIGAGGDCAGDRQSDCKEGPDGFGRWQPERQVGAGGYCLAGRVLDQMGRQHEAKKQSRVQGWGGSRRPVEVMRVGMYVQETGKML